VLDWTVLDPPTVLDHVHDAHAAHSAKAEF
jgi:hypothetical protein